MYGKHSDVRPSRLSQSIFENRCASTHRHHGEFEKPLYGKLWIGPNVVLRRTRVGMGRSVKITNVNLELHPDTTMYLMVENGIRGGISTITKRYAQSQQSVHGNLQ